MNYKLVSFPEIQAYMDHERWDECMLCISTDAENTSSNDYAVPEDLYNEVNGIDKSELKALLEDSADLISMATFELGEDFNSDKLDDKLLFYANYL